MKKQVTMYQTHSYCDKQHVCNVCRLWKANCGHMPTDMYNCPHAQVPVKHPVEEEKCWEELPPWHGRR